MDWQAALRARAIASPALTGLLAAYKGAPTVFWGERPQGSALAAVTLLDLTAEVTQHLKGVEGLQAARVQADVWAESYAAMQRITEALIDALLPPHSGNGVKFTRAMIELGPRDLPERDGEKTIFRKSMDLIVHHLTA